MMNKSIKASEIIDSNKLFMPEELTHLYYLDCYSELSYELRLRYNQYMGCYVNEQIAFFEKFLMQFMQGVGRLYRSQSEIAHAIHDFIEDELQHSSMFAELNRLALPEYYSDNDICFVRASRASKLIFNQLMSFPKLFPLFVWVILFNEERAVYFSQQYLKHADDIEPHFVDVQKRHLQDEADHFQIDLILINSLWRESRTFVRRVNARLFRWMMEEFLCVPKRSGIAVLELLAMENEECRHRLPELKSGLLSLSTNMRYHEALFSRSVVPETMALFDEFEEMHQLNIPLLCYGPPIQPNVKAAHEGVNGF